jgi:hypothetical protein
MLNLPYFLNIFYVTFNFLLTAEHMVAAAIGAILIYLHIKEAIFPPLPFVDWERGEGIQNVVET